MTQHPSRIKGFRYREADEPSEEKIIADVKRHGWHIVGVPDDDAGPGFAFTVGLYLRTLQPETLIMGVPFEPSGRVLERVVPTRAGQRRRGNCCERGQIGRKCAANRDSG